MEGSPGKKLREAFHNGSEKEDKITVESPRQYFIYDILRIIFKYLNGMDLSRASMVCRSWLEAGNNEKRMRGPICSLHKHEDEAVKDLTIKPALGLFFRCQTFACPDWEGCHCRLLPSNCNSIMLGVSGIVIDNTEKEENWADVLSTFLPETPDIKIRTLVLRDDLSTKSNIPKLIEQYGKEVLEALSESEGASTGSKCLLWLCNEKSRKFVIKLLRFLKRRYPGDALSVWGGIVDDISVCTSEENMRGLCQEAALGVGVVLSGSVQTWSVIVDYRYNNKEKVEQRLMSLRNRVRLKKHSMGYMFACFARGHKMFGESNVESSIFKKLFPEVPLVGCFGAGEFGENTIPNESDSEDTNWYNEMSTIFMILTYG